MVRNRAARGRFGCLHYQTRDVIFTEDALFLESDEGKVQIDVLYRFFELFDLKNIPKVDLMLYGAKRRTVVMTHTEDIP